MRKWLVNNTSVYFFSFSGLSEHDFMKKTARDKRWSARVSRLKCTRSPRPVDRGRPQCPVSYPDSNSASHLEWAGTVRIYIDEFRMIWSLLATAKKMALAGHPISLQLRLPAASLVGCSLSSPCDDRLSSLEAFAVVWWRILSGFPHAGTTWGSSLCSSCVISVKHFPCSIVVDWLRWICSC